MELIGYVICVNGSNKIFIAINNTGEHFYTVSKTGPVVKHTEKEIDTVKKVLEEDKKFLEAQGIEFLGVEPLYVG